MLNAYIIEAKRTAIGRSHPEKGLWRNTRADALLAELIRDFVPRLAPANSIDDIYAGCVGQHLEQGKNIARLSALLADLPHTVPGVTINRLCASSLQGFNFAATTLHAGQAAVILAGGVEHMQHVPMTAALDYNQGLLGRFEFPFTNMGLTAEKVADIHGVTRQAQDEFALKSHQKAVAADKAGHFKREIINVNGPDKPEDKDQCPRPDTSLEALSQMKGAFKETGGTVTAGNSSPISDGASLTMLASEEGCKKHGLRKRAQVIDSAVVGLDPLLMGLGPIPAINKLLARNKKTCADIDLFEINEAFAAQAVACVRELHIPEEKLNPFGGAIALGHPLGCTGTRLIATLFNALEAHNKEWGIASMCIGHGQGVATLIRRISHA